MPMNRRSFLRRTGLGAVATLAAPAVVRANEEVTFGVGDRPRHIIHMVADGMSLATLTCANQLSLFLRGRGLSWLDLTHRPGTSNGLMDVRSLNSLVTDSAASSSAWGSGSRVVNGSLNMLPDGRSLRTLNQLFGEAGWKRGLVTTCEITHATPAGFTVSLQDRNLAEEIACQYFDLRMELLLGGGSRFFDPAHRKDARDLGKDFQTAGYEVFATRTALAAARVERPWLGTFAESHLPFSLDQQQDKNLRADIPALAEMTRAALRKFEREEHFLLQIEGGRVDHAAHLNDAASALHDLIAFDEALEVCREFQSRHPDTLLVVTTDHGTGGPSLNGAGPSYNETNPLLHNIAKVKHSHAEIIRQIQNRMNFDGEAYKQGENAAISAGSPEHIIEIIGAATGFKASRRHAERLARFFANQGDALYDLMNNGTAQLGQLLGNYVGVGWTSINHTSDHVPIAACGPGARHFHGFLENVDVFRAYTRLAGIDYENPQMPLMASGGPSAASVEEAVA